MLSSFSLLIFQLLLCSLSLLINTFNELIKVNFLSITSLHSLFTVSTLSHATNLHSFRFKYNSKTQYTYLCFIAICNLPFAPCQLPFAVSQLAVVQQCITITTQRGKTLDHDCRPGNAQLATSDCTRCGLPFAVPVKGKGNGNVLRMTECKNNYSILTELGGN